MFTKRGVNIKKIILILIFFLLLVSNASALSVTHYVRHLHDTEDSIRVDYNQNIYQHEPVCLEASLEIVVDFEKRVDNATLTILDNELVPEYVDLPRETPERFYCRNFSISKPVRNWIVHTCTLDYKELELGKTYEVPLRIKYWVDMVQNTEYRSIYVPVIKTYDVFWEVPDVIDESTETIKVKLIVYTTLENVSIHYMFGPFHYDSFTIEPSLFERKTLEPGNYTFNATINSSHISGILDPNPSVLFLIQAHVGRRYLYYEEVRYLNMDHSRSIVICLIIVAIIAIPASYLLIKKRSSKKK